MLSKCLLATLFAAIDASDNWKEHADTTCLLGIGTNLIPGVSEPFSFLMSEDDCKNACVSTRGCEGVILNKAAGDGYGCFLRKDINLDKCSTSILSETLVLTSTWTDLPGKDCLLGVASSAIPDVAEPVAVGKTVPECQALCVGTAGCEAVILRQDIGGSCFLRQSVEVDKCFSGNPKSNLYILTAQRIDGVLLEQKWQLESKPIFGGMLKQPWTLLAFFMLVTLGVVGVVAGRASRRAQLFPPESLKELTPVGEVSDDGI